MDAAGNQKLAAWTTGKPGTIRLDLGLKSDDQVSAVDGLGQPTSVRIEQAQLALDLSNLPQYVTFRNPVLAFTAAAAWDVQALPTLVAAGSAEPIRVPVRLTNPFEHPCRVQLTLKSPSGEDTASLRLAAGQEVLHQFAFPLVRRDDEFPTATVQATYHEVQANREILIGGAEERRTFVLDNPLRLSVAPVESGLRLTVADPSQGGFEGTAMINGVANPMKLTGGLAEVAVPHSPTAGDQSVVVELRDTERSHRHAGNNDPFPPVGRPGVPSGAGRRRPGSGDRQSDGSRCAAWFRFAVRPRLAVAVSVRQRLAIRALRRRKRTVRQSKVSRMNSASGSTVTVRATRFASALPTAAVRRFSPPAPTSTGAVGGG